MATKVVIDNDILGWGDEHVDELHGAYEGVHFVSRQDDLPASISDKQIAEFCKLNRCDLVTGDKRSYVDFFDAGIKSVVITRRDVWKATKPIFLVRIEG